MRTCRQCNAPFQPKSNSVFCCSVRCRFFSHIKVVESGCWVWLAQVEPRFGYAKFFAFGEQYAHRVAWILEHGPIPKGVVIRHKCDNPACPRHDHLADGAQIDNVRDCVERGRRAPMPHRRGEAHYRSQLTEADVHVIRASTELQTTLAARYGVSQSAISDVQRRKRWAHVE